MQAKEKLRTSEDVYKRLAHALKWEEEWQGETELWIGYEDGIHGPMEQQFQAFVPVAMGGDIPFTRLWYIRRGDRVLWDRRRRMDVLWGSGDTAAILEAQAGRKVKNFDAAADRKAASTTADAIAQARETLARLAEERKAAMDEKQRRKLRQAAKKGAQLGPVVGAQVVIATKSIDVRTLGEGDGTTPSIEAVNTALKVLTWNTLFDDHLEDPAMLSKARAPGIVKLIDERQADIVALQEVTSDLLDEILNWKWTRKMWVAHRNGGELLIISALPMLRAVTLTLGENTSKEALLAEFCIAGRRLTCACLHLTSDRRGDALVDNSGKRGLQVQRVKTALRQLFPGDFLVLGDFNEADGVEAGGVAAMLQNTGVIDVWSSAHPKIEDGEGEEEEQASTSQPGYTFDPSRNHLAQQLALNKQPRRLDRILLSSAGNDWQVRTAQLVGDEGEALSDHFGVEAVLEAAGMVAAKPVHTTALAVVIPQAFWEPIQHVRRAYDPSFARWMPHINVLYGFVPECYLEQAADAIENILRHRDPLHLHLPSTGLAIFEHRGSASIVALLEPSSAVLLSDLQRELQALFPLCAEQSRLDEGYQPHLTLGNFPSLEEARQCKAALEAKGWPTISFALKELCLLNRSSTIPFKIAQTSFFGTALREEDRELLEWVERASHCRAHPVGSAFLLGTNRPSQSDLDILTVGPRSQSEVFGTVIEAMGPSAMWWRVADGKFPVLTIEVNGVCLDVQHTQSPNFRMPVGEQAPRNPSAGALQDAQMLRWKLFEALGEGGWRVYQEALLLVKRWTKARSLDCNALGLLGGFGFSLLLASAALCVEGRGHLGSGLDLFRWMIRRYAAWPFESRAVVPLLEGCKEEKKESKESKSSSSSNSNSSDEGDGAGAGAAAAAAAAAADAGNFQGCLVLPCPSNPTANVARNVSRATLAVLQAEFKSAAAALKEEAVLPDQAPIFAGFDLFVQCQVLPPEDGDGDASRWAEAQRCAAWLESRLLVLVKSLENSQLQVRPAKVPTTAKSPQQQQQPHSQQQSHSQQQNSGKQCPRGWSIWLFGLGKSGGAADNGKLQSAVEAFKRLVQRDLVAENQVSWSPLIQVSIEDKDGVRRAQKAMATSREQ